MSRHWVANQSESSAQFYLFNFGLLHKYLQLYLIILSILVGYLAVPFWVTYPWYWAQSQPLQRNLSQIPVENLWVALIEAYLSHISIFRSQRSYAATFRTEVVCQLGLLQLGRWTSTTRVQQGSRTRDVCGGPYRFWLQKPVARSRKQLQSCRSVSRVSVKVFSTFSSRI